MKKTKSLASLRRLALFKNYFSGWIENFGVVPLFLLAAFLLFPIFFVLFALFVFVTRVLETIFQLLNQSIQFKRICYLSLKPLIVKVLLVTNVYAAQGPISMAIGDHHELTIRNLSNYSIGNKDIVNIRYNSKVNTILIKGKKIGHTQLLIWKRDKTKLVYPIFIINKRSQLKLYQLAQELGKSEIEHQVQGTKIKVTGTISKYKDYKNLLEIISKDPLRFDIQAIISIKLRNQIILDIYQEFINEFVDDIVCGFEGIQVSCSYFKDDAISADTIKALKSKYHITLIKKEHAHPPNNFTIKLKIISLERSDGKEVNFGLDKLSSTVEDLFSLGLMNFINSNKVFFEENNIKASTLAEPEMIVAKGHLSTIQVGKEVHFQQQTKDGLSSLWKFAGLKLKIKLKSKGRKLLLNYNNEFTVPNSNGVSGSKESSQIKIELNQPIKLFEIGLVTSINKSTGIPVLKNIPLLGYLVSHNTTMKSYKRIIAYVSISQN